MKSPGFAIMYVHRKSAGAVLQTPSGVVERLGGTHDMVTVSPAAKQCTSCGEVKPLESFYEAKRGLYGRRSQCKQCISAQRNAYNKQRRREDPERAREQSRRFYLRHRERILAETKAYQQTHQWQSRFKWRRLRAESLGVKVIDLTAQQWEDHLAYFDYRCGYCHALLNQDVQDHITPLSKGGNHTLENVVPACSTCNTHKWTYTLLEALMKGKV